ncbi:MAG TPA: type II toxin-antitoxin system ParD family antitoxin [Verrucomicrobiae bacterium]|nr:type II toxin-antitoxin system ParD family antitoxin [Verrucomicrobiae bacterium]
MKLNLTSEQENFIAERVRSHEYTSPEGVIDEGLRLIRAKEEYKQRLVELRGEIDKGLEQAERGELLDADEVFEKIMETNRKRPRPQ